MKPSELKHVIKPIVEQCVKECVREMMLDSGLLSSVIAEVMKGVGNNVIVENRQETRKIEEQDEQQFSRLGATTKISSQEKNKINNTKKQLLDSIGKTSYGGINIFEGIKETIPDESRSSGVGNPMNGLDPNDPGVDVSFLDIDRMATLLKGKK